MNRDDIIRMAREAGLEGFGTPLIAIERFFHMAQAAMIEQGWRQCAKGQRTTQFCGIVEQVVQAEREAVSDEWWMCVQSDLENGVKSLNEAATEKWQKEYPEISKFAAWLESRGQQ